MSNNRLLLSSQVSIFYVKRLREKTEKIYYKNAFENWENYPMKSLFVLSRYLNSLPRYNDSFKVAEWFISFPGNVLLEFSRNCVCHFCPEFGITQSDKT